ncbi:MAG: hypothetical protein ACWA5X_12855 [bacterium]
MNRLPPHQEQIVQAHSALIVAVVQTVQNPAHRAELDQALSAAEANGWNSLVNAIRQILSGNRDPLTIPGLDEEDATIVDAILRGIQNPATLPDPNAGADASMAAPGLASMIIAARNADPAAMQGLAMMSEQMTSAGGDLAQLGGLMKRLVDGERDIEKLGEKLGAQGISLLESILTELGKMETH